MTREGLFRYLEIVLVLESIFVMAVMIMKPVSRPVSSRPSVVAPVIHPMSRVVAC